MESTLANLPPAVYAKGLLPLLSANEVLRLRRVCKPLKKVCDDYLKKKCPSTRIVRLEDSRFEPHETNVELVSSFLEFDSTINIRIPSGHFYLKNWRRIGQFSFDLSTRYGAQIKDLSMDWMKLPFVPNNSELEFFQNMPGLSRLKVNEIDMIVQKVVNAADRKVVLPSCFQNRIKKFEVSTLLLERESDADQFWETVGLFEKLECFQFPNIFIRHGTAGARCRILENCCKLIERESSNIQCLDLFNLNYTAERSEESLKLFSEQCLRNQIKWKNVPAWTLEQPPYKTAWMPNAHLIVSMSQFSSQNLKGRSLPNLVSLEVKNISDGLPTLPNGWLQDWSKIPQSLSPSIYPALRILKVSQVRDEDNKYFSKAWQYLPNLEDVSFTVTCMSDNTVTLSSEAFLGNDEEFQPPFFRLIRLKKLSFHFRHIEGVRLFGPGPRNCSIGQAFHKAFRLMPLREFIITSQFPVATDVFDKNAILALSSPGPFRASIEKFPFQNWSMEDVTNDEFQQLKRMFPNNQEM